MASSTLVHDRCEDLILHSYQVTVAQIAKNEVNARKQLRGGLGFYLSTRTRNKAAVRQNLDIVDRVGGCCWALCRGPRRDARLQSPSFVPPPGVEANESVVASLSVLNEATQASTSCLVPGRSSCVICADLVAYRLFPAKRDIWEHETWL